MELALLRGRGPGLVPELPLLHALYQGRVLQGRRARSAPARRFEGRKRALFPHPRRRHVGRETGRKQIGRASCREGVCKNVTISVVAVESKKKNHYSQQQQSVSTKTLKSNHNVKN